jgi:hypothetical protein
MSGGGTYTFTVQSTSSDGLYACSREGSQKPELVVRF